MPFSRFTNSFSQTPRWFQWGWILVVAGILLLRFWGISEMAWGYDELSAVFRAMKADNWHDHLHNGVAVDGHPAGLQTVLWLWIRANGTEYLLPRIFTALFSLGVLGQFHGMAKRHFGFETAYWSVCLMGLMWWQAGMSVWIRPYIFALPFVLWSWDLVLGLLKHRDVDGQVLMPLRWGWFAVKLGGALAGAAYIHFFAGLTAGASFIALILLQPKNTQPTSEHTQGLHPSYLLFLPLTFAFLFYLPHIPLTFAQFQLGGLGWLNAPTPNFLWQFLQHATGQSQPIFWLFIGAILYAIQFQIRIAYLPKPASFQRILQQPTVLLTLAFLLAFAIGYLYSVFRAPILQNNALYFAFPLLLMLAAHGITLARKEFSPTHQGQNQFQHYSQPLAILLPALLLYNTLYQKQFLTLERKGSHHRIVAQSIQFANSTPHSQQTKHAQNDVRIWLDGPADNYQFHKGQILHKHKISAMPPTVYFESAGPTLPFIAQQLQSLKPESQVFLGVQSGCQPWLLPLIESHFTHTSRYQEPFSDASQSNCTPTETSGKLIGGEWLTLAQPRTPQFTASDFHLQNARSIHNTADTVQLTVSVTLREFQPNPNDVILLIVKSKDARGDIETSLWNNQAQIDWRSTKIADYEQAGFQYALHALKLADIPQWNSETQLRIRISAASELLIGRYLGNPYLYGVRP
jgi:hypothetical protein